MKVMGSLEPQRKLYTSLSCDILNTNHRDNSTELLIGLLAAQTLKIASINGFKELDDLENELEEEIAWENRKTRDTLAKIRRKGEHILHAKGCLLAIIILNVVDCCLVIGELLAEFHHMNHLIQSKDGNADKFIHELQMQYPNQLDNITGDTISGLYTKLLLSEVCWDNGTTPICPYSTLSSATTSKNKTSDHFRTEQVFTLHYGKVHYLEEKISHILHYISVAILTVLVIETFIKIFCTVPRFFKHKLEIFDAFIVVISLILDLVYLDGFVNIDIGDFVVAVSFILPWRIIRILNSLIVAVMEKERYSLKILYKQKKKVDKVNVEHTNKIAEQDKQIARLKAICESHNVPTWEIQKIVGVPEKTSALGKLAFRAAGSLTPAPMTPANSSTPNLFSKEFTNGSLRGSNNSAGSHNAPTGHLAINGSAPQLGNGTAALVDEGTKSESINTPNDDPAVSSSEKLNEDSHVSKL
ncbi:hypothetical protein SNE40_023044 [Patella caerulea]|uniref:Voltage-gated hydrogen channel 1 n=1 Tax=Patella caerulea TaxID=87958 RepID=A0AAN8GH90_PATCE